MINSESKETLEDMKAEAIKAWIYLFIIQLVVGGHAIYELADKYPDLGFIRYALILTIGAALIAAVLLAIVAVLFTIFGAIVVGITLLREKMRERNNDSS